MRFSYHFTNNIWVHNKTIFRYSDRFTNDSKISSKDFKIFKVISICLACSELLRKLKINCELKIDTCFSLFKVKLLKKILTFKNLIS